MHSTKTRLEFRAHNGVLVRMFDRCCIFGGWNVVLARFEHLREDTFQDQRQK